MLAHYDKIIDILKRCTTDEISEAEQQMKKLALEDLEVLSCLQYCLKDGILDNALKIMATSHLNSLFMNNIAQYPQDFCLRFFTHLLNDPTIPFTYKKELSRALMICIQQCDEQHLEEWKTLTYENILNESSYSVGILLLTAFCCSEIKNNIIEELDDRVFQFLMNILCGKLRNFSEKNNLEVLEIYEIWKVSGDYLLHYQPELATEIFKKWANNNNFIQSLIYVYKSLSTGQGAHFFYLNEQFLYEQINQIKKTALQLHFMVLNHLLQKSNHVRNLMLYQFTGMQIQIFIHTLCYANICPNFRMEYDQEQILIIMLKLVGAVCNQAPMILIKSWKSMLHYLIFPFLALTEEQLVDFQQNTNSFVQISQDCCLKQRMGLVKTQAAKLLQKIADLSEYIYKKDPQSQEMGGIEKQKQTSRQNIVSRYIINFALASIKHNLQMQFIDKNEFFQSVQNQIPAQSKILSVETSFLVLTIFSYCIERFQKQLETLRVIFCNERVANLPPIQRSRIYGFLAYNYNEIFGLAHIQSLKYWVNLALGEQNQPTVAYCALDFLSNYLNSYYDEKHVKIIIQKMQKNKSANYWAILKNLIMQHLSKFSEELLVCLVHESYKRIEVQISCLQSQKIKTTHIITKLLQILKIISEKGQLIQQKPQLRKLLWQVSKLYHVAKQNYFQKQIVTIINCFLFYATVEEIEHPEMSKFIGDFVNDFVKSQYEPNYYYIAFNNYIMKSSLQSIIIPIFKGLRLSLGFFLGELSNQLNRKKMPIAHTLLVLQNLIALHGGSIALEQLNYVYEIVKKLYPIKLQVRKNDKIKKKLSIYDRTILARALNLQLLCHIYSPQQNAVDHVRKYMTLKIYYGYDVGVILSCLSQLIKKQVQMDKLIQLLELAISVIFIFMEVDTEVKIEKINDAEKKANKNLGYDEDLKEYKIDEEEDKEKQKKKSAMMLRIKKFSDYQAILAFIDTPFLKEEKKIIGYSRGVKSLKDIRMQFVQMLMHLYQSNSALIQSIILGFSEQVKYRLQVISENKVHQIVQGKLSFPNLDGTKPQRKKYVIRKVKEGYIEENKTDQGLEIAEQELKRRQMYEQDDEQYEQQKEKVKRRRIQLKKKWKVNKT